MASRSAATMWTLTAARLACMVLESRHELLLDEL